MSGLLFKVSIALKGLLRQASVDPDKHLSMHPALRAQYLMGSHPHALSRIGEIRFSGCIGPYQQCQPRFPTG